MNGEYKNEAREKVPVTPKRDEREREMERDLPQYDGGYDSWRRATELPRRWRVQA